MIENTSNINLTKEDVLSLMIDAFKAGNSSYVDLAENFCEDFLEEFVSKKVKLAAEVTVKIPQEKTAPKPFADFGSSITQTSNVFLNASPPSSSTGTFMSINSGIDSGGFYQVNSLDFAVPNYYNINNT